MKELAFRLKKGDDLKQGVITRAADAKEAFDIKKWNVSNATEFSEMFSKRSSTQ